VASRRRVTIFRVVLLGILLGVVELLSAVTIALLPYPRIKRASALYTEQSAQIRQYLDRSVPHHVEIHPVLGWWHTPNYPAPMNRMNSVGLRGTREYSRTPPQGVLRVAAFGDSFVYGAEVENSACWAGRMERQNPDLEVLNYGVSGYGVDQAYLRYLLDGTAFFPHVVVMGFVPDDINRTTSVYRRFLSDGAALFKPRYVLDADGALALQAVPLKTPADYEGLLRNPREIIQIGHTDYWYPACVYENPLYDYSAAVRLACVAGGMVYRKYLDPDRPIKRSFYNENSSAFKIQARLFRDFTEAVRQRGALPLIVMLPDLKAVERVRHGEPPVYTPLMDYLRSRNLPFVDAADVFRTGDRLTDAKTWFAPGGHYSSSGNQLVAEWLANRIRETSSKSPQGARAIVQNTSVRRSRQ